VRTQYRTMVTILILALTSVLPLRAADAGLPDAPSTSQNQDPGQNLAASARSANKHYYQGASPAGRGGAFGADQHVIDWKYSSLTGAMFAASVANAEMTHRCMAQKTCNFVPSALSSRVAMYGIGIPADFAVAYVSYRLKKGHNWFWIVPEAMITGANLYVAAHSWNRLK
jgi:hypothetical protein